MVSWVALPDGWTGLSRGPKPTDQKAN